MPTISTGVFTALDIGEAVASQKYWIAVNYARIGRFAVAVGSEVTWDLKHIMSKKSEKYMKI